MPLDQFLIAPLSKGLQTDVEPWLIPEEAFAELRNAYVWRGRVRKRFGSTYIPTSNFTAGFEQLGSRLRVKMGTTDGSGDIASIDVGVGNAPGYTATTIGQMFSIGTHLFTVYQTGSPANMLRTGGTLATFDTATGAFTITGSNATTDCYFYPALPVMGLVNYEQAAINDEPTYAFDTRMVYTYTATGWERLGTALWSGSNSQFFWAQNYRGTDSFDTILFVTNNSPTDHVRYWDGSTWTTFQPQYSTTAGDTIEGCRLIISFKNRLLFLNTYERVNATGVTSNHGSRVRFCQDGSPLETGPPGAWYQNPGTIGKGSWVDADTKEIIVSAKILRDRLIVFFERSTWELVFTSNAATPFVFQRINSELGVESTFSSILFDKVLLGVGNVGIHACNGANVERIDEKIPNEVFKIHNGNDGVERVYGIRDYFAEMAYWTAPKDTAGFTTHGDDPVFPTQIIAYNYKNRTWGQFDDSITCFGYIQNLNDETWQMATEEWQERLDVWNDGSTQSEFRKVLAGNQEGYTFIVDVDTSRNAPGLQITQLANAAGVITVTAIDHNLVNDEWIIIENVLGATGLDGVYQVLTTPTTDTFTINENGFGGVYTGAGTISRVSQIDIRTKEYNFYQKNGRNLYIPKVGFYVGRTKNGSIATDYFTSSSTLSMVTDGTTSHSILGTGILETTPYGTVPLEDSQARFWHIIYPQAEGEVIQIRLHISDAQLTRNPTDSNKDEVFNIAVSDFQLNAINIYAQSIHRY